MIRIGIILGSTRPNRNITEMGLGPGQPVITPVYRLVQEARP